MTEPSDERLFAALREALSQRAPQLDEARVRQGVLNGLVRKNSARSRVTTFRLAFAGIAMAATLAVVVGLRGPSATTFRVAEQGGQVGKVLDAPRSQPLAVVFSEGTRVSLGAGSRGRVRELKPNGARIDLERGSVAADVVHRADADWTFTAGPFEVYVLGTELDVSWEPGTGQFQLKVARGAVRVRGPVIQGGQEVRAGQVCHVDLQRKVMELGQESLDGGQNPGGQPAALAVPSAEPQQATLPGGTTQAPTASPAGAVEVAKPSWLLLAQVGKPRDAVAAADRAGLASIYGSASAESLLELARAARLAGRPDVERAALLACRRRAPGQAAAAQAAYLLGRASAPAEAATWFAAYLHDQPRGLLAREASGRLLESHVAAGNHVGAEKAAAQYLAVYPRGPHAAMARQVLSVEAGEK